MESIGKAFTMRRFPSQFVGSALALGCKVFKGLGVDKVAGIQGLQVSEFKRIAGHDSCAAAVARHQFLTGKTYPSLPADSIVALDSNLYCEPKP